jgi:alanyl-tRNA synthetase
MTGDQIRELFTRFFQDRGHLAMPSASLIPAGDPTLLFTSAGMVPFKPFFTGEQTPPSIRMTSSQKSFRTTDIDEVGDHKHLTFFEMLGNFSIGDYFKEGAIGFAWELVTKEFGLAPERIFVTIHLDDDDAYQIWRDQIGVPEERIYRYGDSDNWWGPAGNEGATGPCSEIHYDGGREKGCGDMITPGALTAILRTDRDAGAKTGFPDVPGCHPNCDCERFVELWNLVFMQYYQDTEGNREPLPAPSVDTGMGLERAAVVLQGKNNIYETDLFVPIIEKACQLTGKTYGQDQQTDYALRVVAEHSRAAVFLIGDGVVPGSEGRGYVLRRILRRGIFYGMQAGRGQQTEARDNQDGTWTVRTPGPVEMDLSRVCAAAIDLMAGIYPELDTQRTYILNVIAMEQSMFNDTLSRGDAVLRQIIVARNLIHTFWNDDDGLRVAVENVDLLPVVQREVLQPLLDARSAGNLEQGGLFTLSGPEVFLIHSTYGFPWELTREAVLRYSHEWSIGPFDIDEDELQQEMEAQRQQSREGQAFKGSMEVLSVYEDLGVGVTPFVGYDGMSQESTIAAILVGPSTGSGRTEAEGSGQMEPAGSATKGQQVEVVLAETPFYAEGGGQMGDRGTISGPNGVVRVEDTQSPVAGLIVHRGVVEQGDISLGEKVTAQVDINRRLDASRNHSGTHLLHASLRSILGSHVRQAGSLVNPDRLRFDFSHVTGLSPQEILLVQALSNEKVRDNLLVSSQETTYADAVRQGALAFFGDRYGDVVRMVSMSNGESFSVEVCGGTHVSATGQVGTLLVLGESSIGGGMRRIEAVTGRAAEQLFIEQSAKLDALSQKLSTPVADLEARLDSFISDNEDLKRRLATLERAKLRSEAEDILGHVVDVDGVKVVAARTSAPGPEAMREMGDFFKIKLSSVVVVLGSVVDGSPILIAMVTPDLVDKGLHAGNLARDTAKVVGGGGGGRPDMAQAGGRDAGKLDAALSGVPELIRQSLSRS